MNGREAMQLMLVGNVTVTTFHTCYPYSFYIECTFFNSCEVIANSNVIPTDNT